MQPEVGYPEKWKLRSEMVRGPTRWPSRRICFGRGVTARWGLEEAGGEPHGRRNTKRRGADRRCRESAISSEALRRDQPRFLSRVC